MTVLRHTAPPSHAIVPCGGELLHLLPSHAVWWPAAWTLFIADLHLGKAASFRAHGQPVPSGTTHENFARLDALIAAHRPQRLVVLGDFLHAASGRTPAVLRALIEWRTQHAAVAITLVRGNHDGHAASPRPRPGSTGCASPGCSAPSPAATTRRPIRRMSCSRGTCTPCAGSAALRGTACACRAS